MNRQDRPPIASTGAMPDEADALEPTALDRRRALLSGLSKGGALLAAAAPVSSFAVGRVKTADGKQCTVSGQMSAVMSQAASAVACAAYHPTHFFAAQTVLISSLPNDAPAKLRKSVEDAVIGAYIAHTDGNSLLYKRNTTEVRKLTPANRPASYASVGLTASSILTGASADWVLKVLHATSESDTAYFLAAFFSALLAAPPGAEKVPFPATDVQTQWSGINRADAAALYRLICTLGKDTTKLG